MLLDGLANKADLSFDIGIGIVATHRAAEDNHTGMVLQRTRQAIAKARLAAVERMTPHFQQLTDPAGGRGLAMHDHQHGKGRLTCHVTSIYLCRNKREREGVERFLAVANNALYNSPEMAFTNAGVCLRSAGQIDEAVINFAKAQRIRPNYAEAAYQLADLELGRGAAAEARAIIDRFTGSFVNVTPEMLLLGVRAAHAQGDRLAEERYARRLRLDFPGSDQTRSLTPATSPRHPG